MTCKGEQKICCRCGRKGRTMRTKLEIAKSSDCREGFFLDEEWQFCRACVSLMLDQLSVIISNETWPGDEQREVQEQGGE